MRALVVVEGEEALEGAVDGCGGGEVAAAEGDSPVFVEDGSLESFDEAVGPAVARFSACVVDAELGADSVEEALELAAMVGEDALELPAGLSVGGQKDALEESGAVDGLDRRDDLSESEGAGSIAGCNLPELADTLELADVEAIQANQVARPVGLNMACAAVAGLPETAASAVGEQAGRACAVVLEDSQTFMPTSKPSASKEPMDRAGCHPYRTSQKLGREPSRSPCRPGQSHAQDRSLLVGLYFRRPPAPAPPPARVQALRTVLSKPILPAVEQRPGDSQLPTDLTDVAKLYGPIQRTKTKSLYSLFEGHRPSSLSSFAEEQTLGRLGPLTLVSSVANRPNEVSTPLWDSSI